MPTPTYLGQGQPADSGGSLFGRLGSLFGGVGTPAYSGDGQPSSSGYLTKAPAYASIPPSQSETSDAEMASSCPIDPDALAAGQIAIVIPRQGLGRDE